GGNPPPTATPRPTDTAVTELPTPTSESLLATDTPETNGPESTPTAESVFETPTSSSINEGTPTETTGGPGSVKLVPYVSDKGKWSISYPDGWSVKQLPVQN